MVKAWIRSEPILKVWNPHVSLDAWHAGTAEGSSRPRRFTHLPQSIRDCSGLGRQGLCGTPRCTTVCAYTSLHGFGLIEDASLGLSRQLTELEQRFAFHNKGGAQLSGENVSSISSAILVPTQAGRQSTAPVSKPNKTVLANRIQHAFCGRDGPAFCWRASMDPVRSLTESAVQAMREPSRWQHYRNRHDPSRNKSLAKCLQPPATWLASQPTLIRARPRFSDEPQAPQSAPAPSASSSIPPRQGSSAVPGAQA